MLTLITGVPGAGKTLRAVEKIIELVEHNQKLRDKIAKGEQLSDDEHIFNIYSNINGLKIDEVKPAPEDWRQCEAPAKWFYDEAQYTFPCKNTRGLDDNPVIAEVATHRHLGIDLFLITQHPQLISAHVRKFVGRHEHLDRRYGTSIVSIYMNDALMNVDSSLRRYESEPWTHPKKLFDYYQSASLHINNRRLPFALKFMFGFIAFLILVVGLSAWYALDFFTGRTDIENIQTEDKKTFKPIKQAQAEPQTIQTQSVDNEPVPESNNVYLGCIVSETNCRCWHSDGTPAYMQYDQCKQTFDDMPTSLFIEQQSS